VADRGEHGRVSESNREPPKSAEELLTRYAAGERNFDGANLTGANLRQADLRSTSLVGADLTGANLRHATLYAANLCDALFGGADLGGARLCGASIRRAKLSGARLSHANFLQAELATADLSHTDLSGADLTRAGLVGADLSGADLAGAELRNTDLTGAKLGGADLRGAMLLGAVLGAVDLSDCDLTRVRHVGPSVVGIPTLQVTAAGIRMNPGNQGPVEVFFRGCGVPDEAIDLFRTWIARPIEFYSCFISYSHADKAFARRLFDALQGRGIRCWLDEHELLPGQKMHDEIDRGIRLWDKVLLCCSKASLLSWWVDKEVGHAFAKEEQLHRERGEHVLALVPLNLDGHLLEGKWKSGWAHDVKGRLAADFTGWDTDNAKFEEQFERVVKALQAGERPAPPKSLL
jgi:uncharacterized protein YjbI with pentapeptide repeats